MLCFLMGAMMMSCNSSNTNAENKKARLANNVTIEDIMAVPVEDYFCHYMDDVELPKDFPIPEAVDIYNTATVVNSLCSVDDFWRVFENNKGTIDILDKVDLSVIKDEYIRRLAQNTMDKYKYFFKYFDATNDDTNQVLWQEFRRCLWVLDSTFLSTHHVSTYVNLGEDEYWQALDFSEQQKEVAERLGNNPTEDMKHEMLDDILLMENFEEKCAYTYAYITHLGFYDASDEKLKDVLCNLLTDGRYSHHHFNMWRVWRSIVQYEHGSSKMSDIANGIYNRMRLEVAKNTLNYLAKNPTDKVAINQYLMTAYHKNVARIGDYPYGNQSVIDVYILGLIGE